jgi:hypothetical protein
MRKDYKRIARRNATPQNIIYIFERTLAGEKPIQIYNAIRRNEPANTITKEVVSVISSGNVKVFPYELSKEEYATYAELLGKIKSRDK